MDAIVTKVEGYKELVATLTGLVGLPVQVMRPIIAKYALKLQGIARRTVKVDQGFTRASIITAFIGNQDLSADIGSAQKTAPWIEFGTRPHFPPPDALIPWVRRHGMPDSAAFAIARKIAQRGTPASPFLGPAFDEVAPQLVSESKILLGDAFKKGSA